MRTSCHNLVTKSPGRLYCAATGPSPPPGVRGRCTPPSRAVGCAPHHDVRIRPRRRPFAAPAAGAPTAGAQATDGPRSLSASDRAGGAARAAPSRLLNDRVPRIRCPPAPTAAVLPITRPSCSCATSTSCWCSRPPRSCSSRSMPRLGYAVGAGGWIVTRFASEVIKRRAWAAQTTRARAVLHVTAILGRVWLIAAVDPRRPLRRAQLGRHHRGGDRARGVHGRARDLGRCCATSSPPAPGEPR